MPSHVLRPGDDDRALAVHGDGRAPDVEARCRSRRSARRRPAVGEVEQADLVAAPLGGEVGEALGAFGERLQDLGPERLVDDVGDPGAALAVGGRGGEVLLRRALGQRDARRRPAGPRPGRRGSDAGAPSARSASGTSERALLGLDGERRVAGALRSMTTPFGWRPGRRSVLGPFDRPPSGTAFFFLRAALAAAFLRTRSLRPSRPRGRSTLSPARNR